uniref:G_PROTEIN_RECEP_F1_2 domain-containing protein n=1 Tax=Heterorhabditis bacteriophora TaxID=37862 RepID=A0A1I7WG17_HETBA
MTLLVYLFIYLQLLKSSENIVSTCLIKKHYENTLILLSSIAYLFIWNQVVVIFDLLQDKRSSYSALDYNASYSNYFYNYC